MIWQDGKVQALGLTIHFVRSAPAQPAATLLLAHGITDAGNCWSHVAELLSERYDVISYDARGHGLSQRAPVYRWADLATEAAALVGALGLERPVLMGHSMGAATVATVAADHPSLPRAAILVDPPWHMGAPASEESRLARATAARQGLEQRNRQTVEDLVAQCRVQSPTWPEEELGPWARAKQRADPTVSALFAEPTPPWREIVPRIACPFLLVTGDPERGAIVTPQLATAVSALNRMAQVTRIAEAGHSIQREQYDAFMATVCAFLAQVA